MSETNAAPPGFPGPDDFPNPERDRIEAMAWARGLLSRGDWLLLDTETTALDGRLIEIALVRPNGATLFESLVNPGIAIPNSHLHGITDEMVKDAPTFGQIEPRLRELAHGRTVVVYNAEFDEGILRRELRHLHRARLRLGPKPPLGQVYTPTLEYQQWRRGQDAAASAAREWSEAVTWQCAMLAYAAFKGEWSDRHDSYRYHALNGGHRAAGDCRACLERIREMAHGTLLEPDAALMAQIEEADDEDAARLPDEPDSCPRCHMVEGWDDVNGYCTACGDWISKAEAM